MLTNDMTFDLIQGLRDIFGNMIEQIILYGSVARDEATDESDIDIAIVLNSDMSDQVKKEFFTWSSEMDMRYSRVFSIIDISKDKMEQWGNVLPFYKNIRNEGVILWKAA